MVSILLLQTGTCIIPWTWKEVTQHSLSWCGTPRYHVLTSSMSLQKPIKIMVCVWFSIDWIWRIWPCRHDHKMSVERAANQLCSHLPDAANWSGNVLLIQQGKSRRNVRGGKIQRALNQYDSSGWKSGNGWFKITRMVRLLTLQHIYSNIVDLNLLMII